MPSALEIVLLTVLGPFVFPPVAVYHGARYLGESAAPDIALLAERAWNKSIPSKQDQFLRSNSEVYDEALGPREFRLIRLLPQGRRTATNMINCELTIASREEFRSYTALSYAWGAPSLTHRIKVNGKDFMVTKNLFQALKCLRDDVGRILWIDAVCINQGDSKERGEQVEQMRSIYQDAADVFVWLGNPPKNFKRILDLFDGPANAFFEDKRGPTGHIFLELLKRPWWERMWVVQELILAHTVMVQCGRYRFSWDQFGRLIELYWNDTNKQSNDVQNARTMIATRSQWQLNKGPENGLLDLAWQFRERKAGDDRDRLYALLGLLPESGSSLVADYTKSSQQVYREFAQSWINQHKSLLIMLLSQRQPRGSHHPWYPVWSEPFDSKPEFFCGSSFSPNSRQFWEGKFSADGGRPPPNCIVSANTSILNLKGFIYDTILEVSPTICQLSQKKTEIDLAKCVAAWKTFVLRSTAPSKANSDEVERKFYLAVTAGLFDSEDEMVNHEAVQIAACHGRRIFVTQKGEIGLGPARASQGDMVCVLYGSSVPIVLAECTHCELNPKWEFIAKLDDVHPESEAAKHAKLSFAEKQRTLYRPTCMFVGDAYLHKIMTYSDEIGLDLIKRRLRLDDFYLCG